MLFTHSKHFHWGLCLLGFLFCFCGYGYARVPLHVNYAYQEGLKLGLFFPAQIPNTDSHVWGIIGLRPLRFNLGFGYRQLLNPYCFAGGYTYWNHVEQTIEGVLSVGRWHFGMEIAKAQWGQLTISGYRYFAFPEDRLIIYRLARDIGGLAWTVLVDTSDPLKILLSGAYTQIGLRKVHEKVFERKNVFSFAAGVRWIINPQTDLEIKLVLGKHLDLLHINFQIYLDSYYKQRHSFQNRLRKLPECYIPYYATSNSLEHKI